MCFAIPNWDKEAIDQDDGGESVEESIGVKYFGKPASEHPDWKWVMMNETCSIVSEWLRRADYCQPDNFGMHIYSDFFGYGLQELQENLVGRFRSWMCNA
jgi:hypothetical protein